MFFPDRIGAFTSCDRPTFTVYFTNYNDTTGWFPFLSSPSFSSQHFPSLSGVREMKDATALTRGFRITGGMKRDKEEEKNRSRIWWKLQVHFSQVRPDPRPTNPAVE